jgi:hypothetical protein
VESGLVALVAYLQENPVKSLAMPAFGCGNGGLEWNNVRALIEQHLTTLDMSIWVYESVFKATRNLQKLSGWLRRVGAPIFYAPCFRIVDCFGENTERSIFK